MDSSLNEWAPLVMGAIFGTVGWATGFYFSRQTLRQQQVEELRREIFKKLNVLYGPCLLKLRISTQYYNLLVSEKPEGFSTLRFFLEGNHFQGNDAALYETINVITNDINELILSYSGLVDSPELSRALARTSAHFRIIDLAYKGKLNGEVSRFWGYTYPRETATLIENEIARLNAELDKLNGRQRDNAIGSEASPFYITDPALFVRERSRLSSRN